MRVTDDNPFAGPAKFLALALGALLVLCSAGRAASAQSPQDEETTRKLWDTAFNGSKRKPARSARKNARRGYRVATPRVPPSNVAGDTVVGVTIWRLRPAADSDRGERILEHESEETAEWIPERVSADARLSEGDRVRLSIEAARTGYLYVVDREQYADGTLGDPYLIFPTARTLGGNNRVAAGTLVDIPAQDDGPPYFTLRRSRADQVGELLSVVITPAPLDGLQVAEKAQRLTPEQVASWEKSWGGQVGQLELDHGAGKAWTKEERDASAAAGRPLKPDAPPPQTIYYNPAAKSSEPLLIKVRLRYGRAVSQGRAARR
ncbi:MAG TPA: hypothetical protein VN256_13345 [Pyrinomonadaceae bacterium]|nr:hypothetical protein [Pyrinomonadaceae bacterium]